MNLSSADAEAWAQFNQKLLSAELARLRRRLETGDDEAEIAALDADVEAARAAMPAPGALDVVAELFGLSRFEREALLMCCGVELDSRIATACARVHGNAAHRNATFSLALAVLAEPHWSALTPEHPLRRWRLLEVEQGLRLVDSALRVDERILHFIAGINGIDARLRSLASPIEIAPIMSRSHEAIAARIAGELRDHAGGVIHLDGDDAEGQRDVAAAAAARLGLAAILLNTAHLPAPGADLELLQTLWERETRLLPALLIVQGDDPSGLRALQSFVARTRSPLIVATRDPVRGARVVATHTVDKPAAAEQKQLWQDALDEAGVSLNGALASLAGQFRMSAQAIKAIASSTDADGVWAACRTLGRERLDDLAQRLEPTASWDDLVLPEAQKQTLHAIGAHLRQRLRVYEDWGFARHGQRGLGISAMFCGESGTGKTLAAEVLAKELRLDLYRVDLSTIVSKYIGETEKNLRRVFEAAEDSGAILLFDEADALFGKRSEVKDSHDRYANIEISYLLQRMEAYSGLAVLTTNMKSALDRAFQRRLRFIVNFPFPDSMLREQIWRRAFPSQMPLGTVDFVKLARLNLPGGNIRNIALNAAFLAAETDEPLSMSHLLHAAQSESGKLDRPLADAETRGWS